VRTPAKVVPLRSKGRYWIAEKLAMPSGTLSVKDWAGVEHTANLRLDAVDAATYVPDEGDFTGLGVWFFLVPFLLLITGVVGTWTHQFGIRGPGRRSRSIA
jgi:hypothetical protein